jgi:hypothetical protein
MSLMIWTVDYNIVNEWMILNEIVARCVTCDGHVCWRQVGAPDP